MSASSLWSLRSSSHTCEAVRLSPHGFQLAILHDGVENVTVYRENAEEIYEWADWQRKRLEARGWRMTPPGVGPTKRM